MIKTISSMCRAVAVIGVSTALIGCAGMSKNESKYAVAEYAAGNYASAAKTLEQDLGFYSEDGALLDVQPIEGATLMQLEAAELWRLSGEYARAISHYDAVESLYKDKDTEGLGMTAAENIGAVLVNDSVMSYESTPVERVLTNHYKALSFWAQGDVSNARVEFNRAAERAQRALDRYAKKIEDAQQEAAEDGQKESDREAAFAGGGSSSQVLSQYFPDMADTSLYQDFENPATQYINALYYAAMGETSRARDTMRQARVKIGEHPVVDEDLLNLERNKSLTGGGRYVWVLVEAGRSAKLEEMRIDIPWPSPNGSIMVISLAVPVIEDTPLEFNPSAFTLNGASLEFSPISDSSKLIKTELSKRFPAILTRAIVSATTKALIQQKAAEQNTWAGLAATVYSAFSTGADTRMWEMVPNQWLLAKAALPDDAELEIQFGSEQMQDVEEVSLARGASWLVVVKQPTPAAQPAINLFKL